MEIANGGTGFMLIKRAVFDKLADKVPSYTNDMYHAVDTVREVKVIKEFFATSIDEESNRLLSEDYHFCMIAREAVLKFMLHLGRNSVILEPIHLVDNFQDQRKGV
jgi:hypothetical protein